MKRLITIILILSGLTASAQVDNAVKQVVKPSIDSLKDAISRVQVPSGVIWEEVVVSSKSGNVDTLTAPGIYVLSVEGTSSAVRYVHFFNGQIRATNPMAWSGVGSWSVSAINGRAIVSVNATGVTYKRRKL